MRKIVSNTLVALISFVLLGFANAEEKAGLITQVYQSVWVSPSTAKGKDKPWTALFDVISLIPIFFWLKIKYIFIILIYFYLSSIF